MQSDDDQWMCPSFNSYSQNQLAEIAAKVTGEADQDVQFCHDSLPSIVEKDERNVDDDDEEDDFEFSLVLNDEFEVSGEEMIFGSKSQPPIFPIFNSDLLNNFDSEDRDKSIGKSHTKSNIPSSSNSSHNPSDTIKVPLSRLFIEEEREDHEHPSSSSSEDEVESIPPGRYCVWKPKATAPPSPSTCNKSKSTGFGSKRWKLRDLLRRSNSEGKDSFIFLTPKRKEEKHESKKKSSNNVAKGKKSMVTTTTSSPARRMLYSPASRDFMRGNNESPNRSPKSTKGNGEMPKRKSYLPYRQDLVGFFTTVNSIGRNFSPL